MAFVENIDNRVIWKHIALSAFSNHVTTSLECSLGINMLKTHVHAFFDSELHEVSWHFQTHEAVRPSVF